MMTRVATLARIERNEIRHRLFNKARLSRLSLALNCGTWQRVGHLSLCPPTGKRLK
jgi:hypothetical protein